MAGMATDRLLLDIEDKLEADISKINRELLKTRKMCSEALDKVNAMILHADEVTSDRLDTLTVRECAVKRRLYVKLSLLGQRLHTVTATKKIVEEIMTIGVPSYIDEADPDAPPPTPPSSFGNASSMDQQQSYGKESTSQSVSEEASTPKRYKEQAKHFPQESSPRSLRIGDVVMYTEQAGRGDSMRASVVSTFNDSCVIQIFDTKLIKQVPYSSLS